MSEERRSAAERLEEEDRLRPEPDMPPQRPEVPRAGNKYAWVVGIVMLMIVSVLLFRAIGDPGTAINGPVRGQVIPDFAAPLATGSLEGDANVCRRASECDAEATGKVPACQVVSEDVFNVCEAREEPLVLTFVVAAGADCEPQVDRVERVRERFPEVNFAVVFSGEEREDVEQIVRRRGWGMPVAVDRDGVLTNLYGLAVCPTTVFSRPGGKPHFTRLGNLTEAQLSRNVRRLLRGNIRRAAG